jgi:hypothetical protein
MVLAHLISEVQRVRFDAHRRSGTRPDGDMRVAAKQTATASAIGEERNRAADGVATPSGVIAND